VNEDRSARYNRLRRRATVLSACIGGVWLLLLAATSTGTALSDLSERAGAWLPPPFAVLGAVAVFAVIATLGFEILCWPLIFYRTFLLDRRYGLSSERLGTWIVDHCKALAVGLVLTIAAGLVVTLSHWVSEAWWWAISAATFGLATLGLATAAPTLLMPMFYHFRPLERDALRDRLLTLSARAGVPVLGAFEWGLGEKTTRANAALVGLGRTRRIILSDTLLQQYSEDEIEVILAHELAHHVYRDIWSGVAIESGTIAVALLAASFVPPSGDLSLLARIALACFVVSLLLVPVANAWSRRNERRADRYALDLTRRPAAFISAIRRLGAQNLAEERPSTIARWLFHSHPTIEERVTAAKAFKAA
jgi:STE24 endopeptidase